MRVTFQNQYSNYLRDLGRVESNMVEAQTRQATGRRINSLSDDPVGLARALTMKGLKSGLTQYEQNLTAAKGYLGFSESSLDEAQKLVRRSYELAVSGANGTIDQTGREAMAQEIQNMQNRLVELGNSAGASGQYLFGGQITDSKPFEVTNAGITYSGDLNSVIVEVGPNESLSVNTQASTTFTQAWQNLENLKNNLRGGNTAAIGGPDLDAVKSSDKAFGTLRSEVGAKLRTVEEHANHHVRRQDELSVQISDVEEVDLTVAIVDYAQAQTAYQAALQSLNLSSRLSLVDYIQ